MPLCIALSLWQYTPGTSWICVQLWGKGVIQKHEKLYRFVKQTMQCFGLILQWFVGKQITWKTDTSVLKWEKNHESFIFNWFDKIL